MSWLFEQHMYITIIYENLFNSIIEIIKNSAQNLYPLSSGILPILYAI